MKKMMLCLSSSLLMFALVATGCVNSAKQNSEKVVAEQNIDPDHSPESALDWNGVYKGVLPCTSCEGLEAELTLSFENKFVYKTTCTEKAGEVTVQEGDLKWIDGSIVALNTGSSTIYFMVGENFVELRDLEGKKIETDKNVRLEKVMED